MNPAIAGSSSLSAAAAMASLFTDPKALAMSSDRIPHPCSAASWATVVWYRSSAPPLVPMPCWMGSHSSLTLLPMCLPLAPVTSLNSALGPEIGLTLPSGLLNGVSLPLQMASMTSFGVLPITMSTARLAKWSVPPGILVSSLQCSYLDPPSPGASLLGACSTALAMAPLRPCGSVPLAWCSAVPGSSVGGWYLTPPGNISFSFVATSAPSAICTGSVTCAVALRSSPMSMSPLMRLASSSMVCSFLLGLPSAAASVTSLSMASQSPSQNCLSLAEMVLATVCWPLVFLPPLFMPGFCRIMASMAKSNFHALTVSSSLPWLVASLMVLTTVSLALASSTSMAAGGSAMVLTGTRNSFQSTLSQKSMCSRSSFGPSGSIAALAILVSTHAGSSWPPSPPCRCVLVAHASCSTSADLWGSGRLSTPSMSWSPPSSPTAHNGWYTLVNLVPVFLTLSWPALMIPWHSPQHVLWLLFWMSTSHGLVLLCPTTAAAAAGAAGTGVLAPSPCCCCPGAGMS